MCPAFVFVNLLKAEPQGCCESLLAYSQDDSPLSQTLCDMDIDRMRRLSALTLVRRFLPRPRIESPLSMRA